MVSPATFEVLTDEFGRMSVHVNDEDVTAGTTGVVVEVSAGRATRLTVSRSSAAGRIAGAGVVQVVDIDGSSVAEWLAGLDPGEVQERALAEHDMSQSFAGRVLAVLAEMADDP